MKLNEKTSITIPIILLISAFLFFATTIAFGVNWSSGIENAINNLFEDDVKARKEREMMREVLQKQNDALIKIDTNVEWIKDHLEEK